MTWERLLLYCIGAVVAVILSILGYNAWKNVIELNAVNQANREQLELVIKEQRELQSKIERLGVSRYEIFRDLTSKAHKSNKDLDAIRKNIDDHKSTGRKSGKTAKGSSKVLKNTIRDLRNFSEDPEHFMP